MTLPLHEPYPMPGLTGLLSAFDHYPLVALSEVHGLQEEADFLVALIHHSTFPTIVQDVVVEFGNARYQGLIDRFVAGEPIANWELRPVWRDFVGSPCGGFDAPIYEQFFRTVRAVNRTLPAPQRIRVLLGDPPVDWRTVVSHAAVMAWVEQRNTHYAQLVEREVLQQGRRALLIAGAFHFIRGEWNEVFLLEEHYPQSTYVIVPHSGFAVPNRELEAQLLQWPIPSLLPLAGTWIGNLASSVVFPYYAGAPGVFSDLADGYLYLGPRASLTASQPSPALYRGDAEWLAEVQRRHMLMFEQPMDVDALLVEQGPRMYEA
jgi:hypothetical protein